MKTLEQLTEELNELALTYAMTPEDTSLELVILNKAQYILCSYYQDLGYSIDLPNIYIEFNYTDNDGYCSDFVIDSVTVFDDENDVEIEFNDKNFVRIEASLNEVFEIAAADEYQTQLTLNNLR